MTHNADSSLQSFFEAERVVHEDVKDVELTAFLEEAARQQSNWDLKAAAREGREAEKIHVRDQAIGEVKDYLAKTGLGKIVVTNPEQTFFGAVEESPSGLYGVTTYELIEEHRPEFQGIVQPQVDEDFTIFHGDSQAPIVMRFYANSGMPDAEEFIARADINDMVRLAAQSVAHSRATATDLHGPREKLGTWAQVSEDVNRIIMLHQQGGSLEQN